MTERFIVTGGAGFIGGNLVRALNDRGCDEIIIVDHLNHPAKQAHLDALRFEAYFDKTTFREQLRRGRIPRVRTIFHFGACSSTTETDRNYLHDNNYLYTRELCQWALEREARFIYASSAATYGDGSSGYCDEHAATSVLKPLNLYAWSKHRFDLWALRTGAIRRIAGLKFFNVYGPRENHKNEMRSLVCKICAQALGQGSVSLFRSHRPDYRDGEQRRDFIHVADAVAVSLFFHDRPDIWGLFNCGTGRPRTCLELSRIVFAALNIPAKINFMDMPESIREKYQYHTCADLDKLRKAGYAAPFLCLEEGVRQYVSEVLPLLAPPSVHPHG